MSVLTPSITPLSHLTRRIQTGLRPLALQHRDTPRAETASAAAVPRKRKLSATDLEIPDSEDDEDYGWAEEDEEDMPPMPPQWQGSEDILVPAEGELEREEEVDGEDDVDDEGIAKAEDVPGLGAHEGSGARRIMAEVGDSEDEEAV